jgi:preprotein translocase subunit YajC
MFTDIAYAMAPAGGDGGQGGGLGPLITMGLVFFIFYFLLIRPQQKRLKEHKAFLDRIEKGDEVVTNGGIFGRVTGITDRAITLQVGENVKIKVLKSAISSLQKDAGNQQQQG